MKRLLIVLAMLVTLGIACGESNTGESVGTSAAQSTPALQKVTTYGVGEIIQLKDHTIVLNSASLKGGNLSANFTLVNTGAKEIAVSSLMEFEAKDSEGTKLDQDIFGCDSGFDGTVLPGDKLRGSICWTGATTDDVKIYYTPNFLGKGATVWEITK